MQYYNATVRLAGSPLNEVRKVISAPELLVLQYIHGVDAITKVEKQKTKKINMSEEKQRLKGLYDQSLIKREQSIDLIFGALGALPQEIPEDLAENFGIVDEDDILSVAKVVTKAEKNANAKNHIPQTQLEQDRLDNLVDEEIDLDELAG